MNQCNEVINALKPSMLLNLLELVKHGAENGQLGNLAIETNQNERERQPASQFLFLFMPPVRDEEHSSRKWTSASIPPGQAHLSQTTQPHQGSRRSQPSYLIGQQLYTILCNQYHCFYDVTMIFC